MPGAVSSARSPSDPAVPCSSSAVPRRVSACTRPGWRSRTAPRSSTTSITGPNASRFAEKLGARAHPIAKGKLRRADLPPRRYDIAVEGTSTATGVDAALRALRPGGICTPVGYYLAPGTKVPLMHMYATDAALKIVVSHVRPHLPDLLAFVAETGFPAEEVTTLLADWDDAPAAYRAHTTELVLHRAPLGVSA
ncbi:hypothetical protein [Nocardia sp. NPDC051833]|uniref:hypothetical protein n=1 Tax=Nocardia sp. NPDC051833 TaxID=3155674 RepID=UPI0034462BF8